MCRHLGHVGPAPVTLASLVTEPPHALLVQSYAPADMRGGGTVNADGFGVGFWPDAAGTPDDRSSGPGPRVYKRDAPMWTDSSFLDLAPVISARSVVAAVRSATVGMPVSTAACAPFRSGVDGTGWLFSHNGVVRGWPGSMAALAAELEPVDLLTLDSATDSALLWALVRRRLAKGVDPADALADVVDRTLHAAPGSRLNLLLGDGASLWATAVDHALSVRDGPAGTTVASEPLDPDPGWTPVPDHHLVVVRDGAVVVTPLGGRP